MLFLLDTKKEVNNVIIYDGFLAFVLNFSVFLKNSGF